MPGPVVPVPQEEHKMTYADLVVAQDAQQAITVVQQAVIVPPGKCCEVCWCVKSNAGGHFWESCPPGSVCVFCNMGSGVECKNK